ncbi:MULTISPECIES: helix-hairpin-helix domain-containing protein [Paenibacillus]|uniref:Pathogenicity locus n=1 Tax=Paenibacillus lautus TaxID=1401 RepID=A0A1R1ACC4_PAELA|nr:helix-hairpin-helix domain-containing protein [Paenibacillus lautus]OME83199.1 Pathogenicity locus [Paenibacillus lautus]
MKKNKIPKLDLTISERKELRRNKILICEIHNITLNELCSILKVPEYRAKEIKALSEFQSVPSIGPKFAKDLLMLGYYSLDELRDKNGARLFEDLEELYGEMIDPCVEDQFRLIIHYAIKSSSEKQWWDFTEERKHYRAKHGYPKDRAE